MFKCTICLVSVGWANGTGDSERGSTMDEGHVQTVHQSELGVISCITWELLEHHGPHRLPPYHHSLRAHMVIEIATFCSISPGFCLLKRWSLHSSHSLLCYVKAYVSRVFTVVYSLIQIDLKLVFSCNDVSRLAIFDLAVPKPPIPGS